MTIIKPFRGFLYNKEAVGDLAKVVSPPYDVIDSRGQRRYYKAHPRNFVRIDFGKIFAKDTANNNRHTRAKRFFEEWIKEGVLRRDDAPSFYIYSQEYNHEGERKERVGFISLAKLEDDRTRSFLPHERTFSGPKRDRFELAKEVKANLSPIFSIVIDEDKKISRFLTAFIKKAKPIIDIKFEGIRNRLWRMSDEASINKLAGLVKDKKALIADGHHRYEVALEFRRAMQKAKPLKPEIYDYVMMYFATSDDKGLTILSTYRMIKGISGADFKKNENKIKEFFDIIRVKNTRQLFSLMKSGERHKIGAYVGGGNYFCLSLKQKNAGNLIKCTESVYWRNLGVVILHRLILEKIFGLKGKVAERAVSFTRHSEAAFKWVNGGRNRVAFFLVPPTLEDIKRIAEGGEKMPHKTTYFHPKPLSGLVVNRLE